MADIAPGTYVIKNRKTGYYILPNNDPDSGDRIRTRKVGDFVPAEAKIRITLDHEGLYTLRSARDKFVGDSGFTANDGRRYLEWKQGASHRWVIQASGGVNQYNIKVPGESKFAIDNWQQSNYVTLADNDGPSEAAWHFTSAQ